MPRPTFAVDRTADALFGSTRRNVLALLFGRPGEEFYVREIVRIAGTGTGAVQRELGSLLDAGLVRRRQSGRQVYFSANPESPVFPELRGLLAKTAGIATVVRAGLAELAAGGGARSRPRSSSARWPPASRHPAVMWTSSSSGACD